MRQIIYAWNYREWGGVQIYFLSLIKAAMKICPVIVVLPENSDPKILRRLDDIGAPRRFTPPAPPIQVPGGIFDSIRYRLRVIGSEHRMASTILELSKGHHTIVHVDFGFWQSLLPLFRLSRETHVFVTQHTGMPFPNSIRDAIWKFKGRVAAGFDRLQYLASNNEAKASLGRYFGHEMAAQITVTYTGVDPDEIKKVEISGRSLKEIRRKYDLPDGPLIVAVGQFIERKGCWVVAKALKRIASTGNEITFVWLATSEMSDERKAELDAYGLGSSFRVLSASDLGDSRLEMLSIVRNADIFSLASLQEGLPIALVEAMALGRPCIATAVNAIPEAIEDGVTGLLIPPGDADALSAAISELLSAKEKCMELGTAAREKALRLFNEKATAAATMDLYDSVWKTAP